MKRTGRQTALKLQRQIDKVLIIWYRTLRRALSNIEVVLSVTIRQMVKDSMTRRISKAVMAVDKKDPYKGDSARKKPVAAATRQKVVYNKRIAAVIRRAISKAAKQIAILAVDNGVDITVKDVLGPKSYETLSRQFEIESRNIIKKMAKDIEKDVSQSMVRKIRAALKKGLQEGKSFKEIVLDINAAVGAFKRKELKVIAEYEAAKATNEAAALVYKKAPTVIGKVWVTDFNPCPKICAVLSGQEVGPEEYFYPGYYYSPPAHPHCRCSIAPVYGSSPRRQS